MGKGYCGQVNWQPTCVSIKIMTPKGQIVGKVYIIETITADKGCKILRCTVYTNWSEKNKLPTLSVSPQNFNWLMICSRLSNRTLVEDGLSLNGTTLFELRYDESEHRFLFPPQNVQFLEITNCSLSNFCDIILFSHSQCTAFPLKREQRNNLFVNKYIILYKGQWSSWNKTKIQYHCSCGVLEITRVSFSASGASST